MVHFATAVRGGLTAHRLELFGALGRDRVRLDSVRLALALLRERLDAEPA
jgi:hypothetical protein